MIKRLLERLLAIAKRVVDDTIPEEELYAYIKHSLLRLEQHLQQGTLSVGEPHVWEILQSTDQLREVGAASLPEIQAGETSPSVKKQQADHGTDQTALSHGKILVETVNSLLTAVDQGELISASAENETEILLRHVEIHRKAGLDFIPTLSLHEKWRATASLSLLFTRVARLRDDVRFLNAALKLNDWAYMHYRKRGEISLDYLCALMEAEVALGEMAS